MSGMRPRANTLTSTQSNIIHDQRKCKSADEKIEEAIHMIRNATISKPQTTGNSVLKEPSYFYKPRL
nr:BV-like protein [Cotesia vestalis bracovirus]